MAPLPIAALAAQLCAAQAPLPEGDGYVRGLLQAQAQREEALSRYTYDVEERVEELDGSERVRRLRTREFEVFLVKGRPVRRLVARDGRPLAGREREQEERRVRELAASIRAGQAANELPGLRLSKILGRYRFTASGREQVAGRCALAFDFTALASDFDLDHDGVLRRLAGRLWVDEEERSLARLEVHNTSRIKLALGLALKLEAVTLRAEWRRLEAGVWLPREVETRVKGRKLLVSRVHERRTMRYSTYRRFEVDVEEELREPEAPPEAPPKGARLWYFSRLEWCA